MRLKKNRYCNSVTFTTHKTKSALQEVLPRAEVTGGSFISELPSLDQLSAQDARSELRTARAKARKVALNNVANRLDCRGESSIEKTPEGFRTWPDGYTGSVTHKGSIVLSAVVENRFIESLGIDLEFDHNGGEGLSHVVNRGELPDYADSKSSVLGIFSTKESIYKAYYPIKQDELNFNDVRIEWLNSSPSIDYGIAKCPKSIEIEVQCVYLDGWIVSTAQLRNIN